MVFFTFQYTYSTIQRSTGVVVYLYVLWVYPRLILDVTSSIILDALQCCIQFSWRVQSILWVQTTWMPADEHIGMFHQPYQTRSRHQGQTFDHLKTRYQQKRKHKINWKTSIYYAAFIIQNIPPFQPVRLRELDEANVLGSTGRVSLYAEYSVGTRRDAERYTTVPTLPGYSLTPLLSANGVTLYSVLLLS